MGNNLEKDPQILPDAETAIWQQEEGLEHIEQDKEKWAAQLNRSLAETVKDEDLRTEIVGVIKDKIGLLLFSLTHDMAMLADFQNQLGLAINTHSGEDQESLLIRAKEVIYSFEDEIEPGQEEMAA